MKRTNIKTNIVRFQNTIELVSKLIISECNNT